MFLAARSGAKPKFAALPDLGLGAASAEKIELITADSSSAQMADKLSAFLS